MYNMYILVDSKGQENTMNFFLDAFILLGVSLMKGHYTIS